MNNLPNDPAGSIPVDQAAQWTANWRDYLTASNQAFNITSFLIPIESIKNLLLYNENAEGIRVYLALEIAADPATAKLVLVPVVDNSDVVAQPADNSKSNVYDYTDSCPPKCPPKSPLNE
ncbi:MAG: hypothetical protein EOP46_03630 [Sphingobacteriaceae bacterium]|nr:MAG: hypothetical protein EOP46_03630 [Sphingobacteriaceae bacterium]